MGRAQGASLDQPDQWEADVLAHWAQQALQVGHNRRHAAEDGSAGQRRRQLLLREHSRRRRLHGLPAAVEVERKRAEDAVIANHGLRDEVLTWR